MWPVIEHTPYHLRFLKRLAFKRCTQRIRGIGWSVLTEWVQATYVFGLLVLLLCLHVLLAFSIELIRLQSSRSIAIVTSVSMSSRSLVTTFLSESTETGNGGLGSHSWGSSEHVGTSCNLSSSALAFPDSGSNSSHALLQLKRMLVCVQWMHWWLTLPLNGLTYLALWVISNFLTIFLREAP